MSRRTCIPALAAALVCVAPCLAADADRIAAAWVIHMGGAVTLTGSPARIADVADLPRSDFQIRAVDLTEALVGPLELDRIGNLPHLKELYLSGRTWHNVPVKTTAESLAQLARLTELERFIITLPVQAEIPIEDIAIANMAPLAKLRQLRLAQTRIKGRTLGAFTEMRALDLTNTRLDDEGMKSIAKMPLLEKLYAHDALITDEGMRHLKDLTHLVELDLYAARIGDASMRYLKGLTGLRKLNLLGSTVTDAGLDQLASLTELEELNLYRTRITNAGMEKLKKHRKLRLLDVRYTAVNRGGVEALRASIPGLQIDFMDAAPGVTRQVAPPGQGAGAEAVAAWVRALGGSAVIERGQIVEISLAATPASDADLARLKGLPGLRKLDLRATQAGDLGLRNLGLALCRLEELSVANTTASDAGLEALAACTNLSRLNASYTLVQGPGLAKLPANALTELDLAGGSAADAAAVLPRFVNLRRLNVSYSDIGDGDLPKLAELPALRQLDLTATDITDRGLPSIGKLAGLTELLLNHGRFTEKGLESLRTLASLKRLELVRTRTTDRAVAALAELKGLERLNLDYTSITDKALAALASLPSLTHLSLDTAAVTDDGIASLKAFRQLRSLNLYHTLATEAAVEALKKALPDCKVVWDRGSNLPTRRGS